MGGSGHALRADPMSGGSACVPACLRGSIRDQKRGRADPAAALESTPSPGAPARFPRAGLCRSQRCRAAPLPCPAPGHGRVGGYPPEGRRDPRMPRFGALEGIPIPSISLRRPSDAPRWGIGGGGDTLLWVSRTLARVSARLGKVSKTLAWVSATLRRVSAHLRRVSATLRRVADTLFRRGPGRGSPGRGHLCRGAGPPGAARWATGLRCYGAMGLRRRPRGWGGRAGGGGTSRWRHRRRRRGRRARGRSRRCRARCTNPWRTPAGRRPGAAR